MTTVNAKANTAYHDLITEYEREHPDGVWAGFSHQRDAFEEGWELGYEAAPKAAGGPLREFADWVLRLDDPGNEDRCTVNLTQIITLAAAAVVASDEAAA